MLGFKIVNKEEYKSLLRERKLKEREITRLREENSERIKEEDKIKEQLNEIKDDNIEYRMALRGLKKKLLEEKQNQQYGSIENLLNKIISYVDEVEKGD